MVKNKHNFKSHSKVDRPLAVKTGPVGSSGKSVRVAVQGEGFAEGNMPARPIPIGF